MKYHDDLKESKTIKATSWQAISNIWLLAGAKTLLLSFCYD